MKDDQDFKRKSSQFDNQVHGKSTRNKYNSFTEEYKWLIKARSIVFYMLGVIEVLLFFRLTFKLLGANQGNSFIAFLYSLTSALILPFYGIFRTAKIGGTFSSYIFEPSIIIAMIVYAIIAWGIVKLLNIKITENI